MSTKYSYEVRCPDCGPTATGVSAQNGSTLTVTCSCGKTCELVETAVELPDESVSQSSN